MAINKTTLTDPKGLVDKSNDSTFSSAIGLNEQGALGKVKLTQPGLVRIENVNSEYGYGYGYGLKYRVENSQNYAPIGHRAIDLSLADYKTLNGPLYEASGNYSTTLGQHCIASGTSSIAIGYGAEALQYHSIAIGHAARVYELGFSGIALGYQSKVYKNSGIAIGNTAQAKGEASVAIGSGNVSNSFSSITLGTYPIEDTVFNDVAWVSTDSLFTLGCGRNFETRADAIKVYKNGLMLLPSVTTELIESNIKSVVTKEYVDLRIPPPPKNGDYKLEVRNGIVMWVEI